MSQFKIKRNDVYNQIYFKSTVFNIRLYKCKCDLNAIVTKTQCHQNTNITKRQMSSNWKCDKNSNVIKTHLSPNHKCYQVQISPLGLISAYFYLPNGVGTTRCPGLVHIYPNGLPGHGLSDSRVVVISKQIPFENLDNDSFGKNPWYKWVY